MNTAVIETNPVEEFCPIGYQMLEAIGEGGFGTIRKARQISTGQMVAIKTLRLREMTDEQRRRQIERFERETGMVAQLHHPHIVKLIDRGYADDGNPYAIYEYIQGETLKDYILRQGGLSAVEAGELMGQVLDALSAAHAAGIVHRDLKPQNIMVTRTGSRTHASILDFGIGGFTHDVRGLDYRSLTLTQEVLGTPAYTAPEQLRGEGITPKSDVYTYGLIWVEILTGQPAIQGNSLAEVMEQQLSPVPVPLPPAIIGHPLGILLRKVLDKNVRKRPASAAAIMPEFQRINFSSLVGRIEPHAFVPGTLADEETGLNHLSAATRIAERKQITVLCLKLRLLSPDAATDPEVLDTLLRDQLHLCTDTVTGLGGYVAGSFAGTMMVYFGYPHTSDTDARRAGRAALDLMQQVRRRGAALQEAQGVGLHATIGIHTGGVTVHPAHTPDGLTIIQAKDLMLHAEPGTIVVSEASRKLLDPFLEFDQTCETGSETAYTLIGERHTEALSFLRPSSADRAMVGREAERSQIAAAWDLVKAGTGQAVCVQGQAGIGKSKLAFEAKKLVRAQGFVVREARCLPEHQNNALHAFIDLLRRHFGLTEGGDKAFAINKLESALRQAGMNLEEVMPILGAWFHIALSDAYAPSMLPPDKQKLILFEAMHKLIGGLGQGNPLLLVIEDLHWLDPTGEEFVNALVQNAPAEQGLILMTARPEFQPTWTTDAVLNLELSPLPDAAVRSLVEAVLQGKPIDEQALAYIVQKGDGIPLYIEEFAATLLERNFLVLGDRGYYLIDKIEEQSIPATLSDLLNARLDRLGYAKVTAQLAAIIGREFTHDLLAKASLREEAEVQTDLELLLGADLIYQQRRVLDDAYVFRHALIRDAAYEGMGIEVRKAGHLRVARSLERDFPQRVQEQPFEVGSHYAKGGEFKCAIPYGLRASKISLDRSADQEVLEYTRVLDGWMETLVESELDCDEVLSMYYLRTNALMNRFGWTSEEVKPLALKAHDLIMEKGYHNFNVSNLISAFWVLFTYFHVGSNRKEADDVTLEFEKLADSMGDPNLIFSAKVLRGIHIYHAGNLAEGVSILRDLVSQFDKLEDVKPQYTVGLENRCWAHSCLALVLWVFGEKEEAMECIRMALKRALALDHKPTTCIVWFYYGILHLYNRDKKQGRYCAEKAIDLASKYNLHGYLYYAKCILFWANDDVEALDSTVDQLQKMGCHLALTCYKSAPALYEFENGKVEEALNRIDQCLKLCEENGEYYYQNELLKMRDLILS